MASRCPPVPERRRRTVVLALVLAGLARPGAAGPGPAIAVVVAHGTAVAAPLSHTLVEGLFARKRLLWDDRTAVIAVNLPAAHPLRREFSVRVFGRTPEDMQDYWNEQYFHGVVPPPVLASEEAVLRFVAATPGAVGYVWSCNVDHRVEVIALVPDPEGAGSCPR